LIGLLLANSTVSFCALLQTLKSPWYGQLDAPRKQLYTFDNAGHLVAFEQFTTLQHILTETVLPETYPYQN